MPPITQDSEPAGPAMAATLPAANNQPEPMIDPTPTRTRSVAEI